MRFERRESLPLPLVEIRLNLLWKTKLFWKTVLILADCIYFGILCFSGFFLSICTLEARAAHPSQQQSARTLLAASAMYLTKAGSTMGWLRPSSVGGETRQQPVAGASAVITFR
jgi:hypothetical protein